GVEDVDPLRIRAEPLQLAAIRVGLLPRDQGPGSNKLILEGLLLTDCAAGQQGEAQRSDRRNTEKMMSVHGVAPSGERRQAHLGMGPYFCLVAPEEHLDFIFLQIALRRAASPKGLRSRPEGLPFAARQRASMRP